LVQALSISEVAANKHACAAALSPAEIAASTFLMEVFTLDLIALFLAVLVSVVRILFLADLMLANLDTSDKMNYYKVLWFASKSGHGQINVNML